MKIRFVHPATVRLSFAPGDEIQVSVASPEIQALLNSERVDGKKVAHVVRESGEPSEEVADVDHGDEELATVGAGGRGRARGHRQSPVS